MDFEFARFDLPQIKRSTTPFLNMSAVCNGKQRYKDSEKLLRSCFFEIFFVFLHSRKRQTWVLSLTFCLTIKLKFMESLMITQDYLQAVKALKDAIMQSRYRTIQHVDMF